MRRYRRTFLSAFLHGATRARFGTGFYFLISAFCINAGWTSAQVGQLAVRQDTVDDAVVRRTDANADGAVDPSAHRLPDLMGHSIGRWGPHDPAGDIFTGQWQNDGTFVRFDMIFAGVVNPPGPLGCCGNPSFAPFRYGPNPVVGFIEIDMDDDVNTGGEIASPHLRYLGNAARFGGLPRALRHRDRAARDARAFDNQLDTPPLVERSGEDFHVALVGWEILDAQIRRSDNSDIEFGPGETWIIPGHFLQRSHAYRRFSSGCCRAGAVVGSYEPLVTLRWTHLAPANRTVVSLVYPLVNEASAAMNGDVTAEPMDVFYNNHNSVLEGLFELKVSAASAGAIDRSEPAFKLIAGWQQKNPGDFLDPRHWQLTFLLGGPYVQAESGGLFVWSDIWPDVRPGDMNGNSVINAADLSLFNNFLQSNDGQNSMDVDGAVNGSLTIPQFGLNFSLFDINYDGLVDVEDRRLIGVGQTAMLGDLDHDHDVDQTDFGMMQACLTDENTNVLTARCRSADLDGDDIVDQDDLHIFEACASGPNVTADFNCRTD